MNKIMNLYLPLNDARKTALGIFLIIMTIALYCATVYLGFRRHPFFNTPERINGWAMLLSLASLASLLMVYWMVRQNVPDAIRTGDTPSLTPSKRIHIIGLVLASLGVAVCLPATLRAVDHPREVMIFWHDEGATLELVQAFVVGEKDVPDYRFTQGWITFLPVALLLKGLNALVPIHYTVTNVAMRSYQLLVIFFILYYTYRLIWQITRSWWMAIGVVLIAYTRSEFFHISLAIDRPDTFQLLFVLLSLIQAHRFWIEGQSRAWFLAVLFASLAFASKYSGHLLTPVLLITWIAHWRNPAIRVSYSKPWKYWLTGAVLFSFSIGLIFPLTFFVLSPYHLIKLQEVLHFFRTHLAIYKTGNVYSLPDHEMPSHLTLWWGVFTSRYAFDYWLTIIGLLCAAGAVVKNTLHSSRNSQSRGEWLLLSWGACYISFLIYQYGLVDYRYIMPVQYVLPFFLLLPLLWFQQSSKVGQVPYRSALGFTAIAGVLLLCSIRINDTLNFLAFYRSEQSVQQCYDVGRFLDRTIDPKEDPRILVTNLAYIPPRFTNLFINNVDVTSEYISKYRFDYVIMTDNMYAIYADKPTVGCEKQFDPIYKVHYVDVVEAYTKFKNKAHPDYRYVRSFPDFHIFERIDRASSGSRFSSAK